MKWINADEQTPKEGIEVLIYNGLDYYLAHLCAFGWIETTSYQPIDNVIFWMQLPPRP